MQQNRAGFFSEQLCVSRNFLAECRSERNRLSHQVDFYHIISRASQRRWRTRTPHASVHYIPFNTPDPHTCCGTCAGSFLWLAQSRKDLFCVWDQDGQLRPSSVPLPPDVKIYFFSSGFAGLPIRSADFRHFCVPCRWSWPNWLPALMLCGVWILTAESIFGLCLHPVPLDSTGPPWTSASSVCSWVIRWEETEKNHYFCEGLMDDSMVLSNWTVYHQNFHHGSSQRTPSGLIVHSSHAFCLQAF